ncbi:hypothetical protein FRC12_008382 [Ceratobasidium sp. 428]|nr:hypothetical protein FRC12_008382 [Ceratobasidium sp. 428]
MSTAKIPSVFSLRFYTLPVVIPKKLKPGFGGMYAAAKEGLNKPIEVAAQVPEYMDYQKWRLVNPDKTEDCQILFVPSDPQVELGGSGFTSPSESPERIVTLSEKPSSYLFRDLAVTEDGQPIVSIHPTDWNCPSETEAYVTVSSDNQVIIQCFPKNPTEMALPGWIVY